MAERTWRSVGRANRHGRADVSVDHDAAAPVTPTRAGSAPDVRAVRTPAVPVAADPGRSAAPDAEEDLGSLTVGQLRARARERGLKGYSSLRKADLIELLSAPAGQDGR